MLNINTAIGGIPTPINLTPTIRKVVDPRLNAAAAAIDAKINSLSDVKQKAEALWSELSRLHTIAPDLWFSLNPRDVKISGFQGEGDKAKFNLGITALPQLLAGSHPSEPVSQPLPPLKEEVFNPGFAIVLDGHVDFWKITEELRKNTIDTPIDVSGHSVLIKDVDLRAHGNTAVLHIVAETTLSIIRKVKADIYLTGHPRYDENTGVLSIPDLEYTTGTTSAVVNGAEWLLHDIVKQRLRNIAKNDMRLFFEKRKNELLGFMNRELSNGVLLHGTVDHMSPYNISTDDKGFIIQLQATGNLSLIVTDLNL